MGIPRRIHCIACTQIINNNYDIINIIIFYKFVNWIDSIVKVTLTKETNITGIVALYLFFEWETFWQEHFCVTNRATHCVCIFILIRHQKTIFFKLKLTVEFLRCSNAGFMVNVKFHIMTKHLKLCYFANKFLLKCAI